MFDRRKDAAQNAQTDRPTPAPGRAGAPAGGLGASRPGAGVGANPGAVGAGPVGGAATGPVGAKAAIGPTILVKGELSGDEDVVIAGQFEGEIDLPNHTLTIVEGGQVRANIQADNVVVQGEATGDVTGFARVVVVRTGHVRGNIKSRSVIIEDGAVFNGSIDMTGPEAEGAGATQRGGTSAAGRSRAAGSGDAGGAGRAAGDGAGGVKGAPQAAQSKPSP